MYHLLEETVQKQIEVFLSLVEKNVFNKWKGKHPLPVCMHYSVGEFLIL